MKIFPPHMLVKTWLQVIKSDEEGLVRQKIKLYKSIKMLFGTLELANLYVEQIVEDKIEDCFILITFK